MERQRVKVKATSRPMLTVVPMDRPVDAEIVSSIECIAKMAADGRLCSVAIAGVHRDGAVTTIYVTGGRTPELMGAIQVVTHRVNRYFEGV